MSHFKNEFRNKMIHHLFSTQMWLFFMLLRILGMLRVAMTLLFWNSDSHEGKFDS